MRKMLASISLLLLSCAVETNKLEEHTHDDFLPLSGGTLAGDLGVNGDVDVGDVSLPATVSVKGNFDLSGDTPDNWVAFLANTSAIGKGVYIRGGDGDNDALVVENYSAASRLLSVKGDGKVGIGIGSPTHPLHVVAPQDQFRVSSDADGTNLQVSARGGIVQITSNVGPGGAARLDFAASETVLNQDGEALDLRVESDGNPNAFFVHGATSYVGVGTMAPSAALDVGGYGPPAYCDGNDDLLVKDHIELWGSVYLRGPGMAVLLTSPNGMVCKQLGIDDSGTLVMTDATCL